MFLKSQVYHNFGSLHMNQQAEVMTMTGSGGAGDTGTDIVANVCMLSFTLAARKVTKEGTRGDLLALHDADTNAIDWLLHHTRT